MRQVDESAGYLKSSLGPSRPVGESGSGGSRCYRGEMEIRMNNPIRLYMSMSLDGYIAGPDDRPGQELGRDGGRLFNWLDDRESDGPSGQVYREAMATGAVISGRRTFELDLVRRLDDRDVTHLRYRVRRPGEAG